MIVINILNAFKKANLSEYCFYVSYQNPINDRKPGIINHNSKRFFPKLLTRLHCNKI